jgi:formylglycine-generating enzyme required for sulfatase activity
MNIKVFICLLGMASMVHAEHRVALLIGNSRYQDKSLSMPAKDLGAVAAALQKRGFHCKRMENVDESQLKVAIESFASKTPTRSTALVYFSGQVLPGSYKGKHGVCLLGINSKPGRGYSLALVLQDLFSKGGSAKNLVVIDSPTAATEKVDLPSECSLSYGGLDRVFDQLSGEPSVAIGPPDQFSRGRKAGDEWVNSLGIVFCWCPPGTYTAGSPESETGRYPDETQRKVAITDGFWLSKYELTLGQRVAKRGPGRGTLARHKLDPVTMINHDDARQMTRTFTESERKAGRLPDDWQYALPTDDQWEYAARAGTTTQYYFGDDVKHLPKHANFADKTYYDSGDIYSNAAHRTLSDGAAKLNLVGSYAANPWGFHDMHGNVAEWCINLAIRGGSWTSTPPNCRSAYIDSFSSRNEQNFIGYRLVIQPVWPKKEKLQ